MTDTRLIRIVASIFFASGFLGAPVIGWAEGGDYAKENMFQNNQRHDPSVERLNTENTGAEEAQIVLPRPPKRPQNLEVGQATSVSPTAVETVRSLAAPASEKPSATVSSTVSAAQNEEQPQGGGSKLSAAPVPPVRPSFATDTAQPNSVNAPTQLASNAVPGVSFSRVSLSTPSVASSIQEKASEPVVPIFTSVPLPPQRPKLADAEEELPPQMQAAVVPQRSRSVEAQKYPALDSGDRPINFFQQSFEKVPEPQDSPADEAPANPRILSKLNRVIGDDPRSAAELRSLINKHASENGIPFKLADAVVRIESRYNSAARNGPYMGLMQIHPSTARALGYSGDSRGLLDPDTNLRYGIKYLAMAYRLANGDTCGTVMRYQGGHRAVTMSNSARKYCSKIKMIFAENQY